jgi:hypothetical protein
MAKNTKSADIFFASLAHFVTFVFSLQQAAWV